MRSLITNCPNCGAPYGGGDHCEYCGTKHKKHEKKKSCITITSDSISIWTEETECAEKGIGYEIR